ncbi:calcium-binding protein [Novosphingobium cyanobacteriorum]|uniref:Calcium-binding protein n=1 Tax=Novosphingobium cyanobacteriorum TaxID=3024215 RepID=A0ABT6CE04_9SPHN|nr:calcium-binding protein [Novosphingobium cyanobacteriorum]MDF8332041.1 calcium-binding protein [Novosphingobium cyanobacteriorum]
MTAFVAKDPVLVNTTTTGKQFQSAIGRLADGGYVVAWVDASGLNGDNSGAGIMAQVFDAKGAKVGGEIQVNTSLAGDQVQPAIAVLKSGEFVISWTDAGGAKTSPAVEVRAQMFNAAGEAIRAELTLNTAPEYNQYQSQLTALSNGGFAAVWLSNAEFKGVFYPRLHVQFFDAKGKPTSADIAVYDHPDRSADEQPEITALSDGRVLVTWVNSRDGAGTGAQIISSDGTKAFALPIDIAEHIASGGQADVLGLPGGGFVAAYEARDTPVRGIQVRIFDKNGEAVTPDIQYNDKYDNYYEPSIALLKSGKFVIVAQDGSNRVVAQVFNPDGTKFGGMMTLSPQGQSAGAATVVPATDGGFIVTWSDVSGADGNSWGVYSAVVSIDNTVHQLAGNATANTLTAPTTANWTLLGKGGDDSLTGSLYDDRLDGGTGADRMTGGYGDDTYTIDNAGDVIIEIATSGVDKVISTLKGYTLAANVEILQIGGNAAIGGNGNDGANLLIGNEAANALDGGRGDDTLRGLGGNDSLAGGAGRDLLEGGIGNDTMDGGNDDDSLDGGAGDDVLLGGAGKDLIDGGKGADRMEGGSGDDAFGVDNLADVVVEKADQGTDTVVSSINYVLGANLENLILVGAAKAGKGNALDNVLIGNALDNTLVGNGGNDVVSGGAGIDKLSGGAGADTFVFAAGESGASAATADRVLDFRHAQGDRIDLSAFDPVPGGVDNALSFIGSTAFAGTAGEVRVTGAAGGQIVQIDADGDKLADMVISVRADAVLQAADFVL